MDKKVNLILKEEDTTPKNALIYLTRDDMSNDIILKIKDVNDKDEIGYFIAKITDEGMLLYRGIPLHFGIKTDSLGRIKIIE